MKCIVFLIIVSFGEITYNIILSRPLSKVGAEITKWHLSSLQIAVPEGKVLLPSTFHVFTNYEKQERLPRDMLTFSCQTYIGSS
jgi:hypothetical protein